MIHRFLPLLVLMAVLPGALRADGLRFLGPAGPAPALALESEFRVEVTGLLARTSVRQVYRNTSGDWLEASYSFPLPPGAAVDALDIRIGERHIEGVIQEREAANDRFRDAARAGHSAGLVEQAGSDRFTTAVTNVAPGETIELTVGFSHRVAYRDGAFRLRIPTTWVAPYDNGFAPASRASASGDPTRRPVTTRFEFSMQLRGGVPVSAPRGSHHRLVTKHESGTWHAGLEAPSTLADRDIEIEWFPADPQRSGAALFVEDFGGYRHALLMLVPPTSGTPVARDRDLVLVLDVSGSMQGPAIEQARLATAEALARLGRGDRFNIIAFSDVPSPLFPHLVPASTDRIDEAIDWIASLGAGGGTDIGAALDAALAHRTDPGHLAQIVLATDGAVADENGPLGRVREGLGEFRLFPVGIGHGAHGGFLGRLARAGRGTDTAIADPAEIGERMAALFRRLERPVLTDLRVDWPEGSLVLPEPLPDLYAGEPLLAWARFERGATMSRIRAAGRLGDRPWQAEWSLAEPRPAPGVAAAWARTRVDRLRFGPPDWMDAGLVDDEILLLGLDYGIVTPRTSLVAVDRTPRRSEGARLRREATSAAAPAGRPGSLLALPQTATASRERLLGGVVLLVLALLASRLRLRAAGGPR